MSEKNSPPQAIFFKGFSRVLIFFQGFCKISRVFSPNFFFKGFLCKGFFEPKIGYLAPQVKKSGYLGAAGWEISF